MKTEIILECRDLSKRFGKKPVLRNCSLELYAGERVGLVGENGSGKSTFVNCVLGFVPFDSGTVQISGKGTVGFCPQANWLHRRLRVSEHLALVDRLTRAGSESNSAFVDWCVQRLKLQPFLSYLIGDLSGGTYQKVKFLTAIYPSPRLLLLDEPYDGFDWQMYQVFWEIMAELQSRGSAVLMISHLIYDQDRFDRILNLKGGRLEQNHG
ncbi:MAG: ATP-binding cassette domain-containing protein [Candidatus Aminicenantaceae bacterium]